MRTEIMLPAEKEKKINYLYMQHPFWSINQNLGKP